MLISPITMNQSLRILFASPYCLLDTTSGAALATRELLDQLVRLGFPCSTVTASIFDPARQVSLEEVLLQLGDAITAREDRSGDAFFVEVSKNGIAHTILKTDRSQRLFLTSQEEETLLSFVERAIGEFHPDLILTYGGLSAERKIHRLAHQRGIPVVFYLHNSLYKKAETFSDVDLVLAPSKFISDFYAERLGIQSQVLYPIFNSDHCLVTRRNPRFFTFMNPVPEKGLTLFARLVGQALRQLPRAEFLVVEVRWTKADVARRGFKFDRIPNIKVISHQQEIKTVYAETRALLHPSFWVEAFGRTIVEAQANGIPVLASRQGGIPEAMNGGGFLFDLPEQCKKNYMAIPTPEDIQPWMDQLRVLLEDEEAYAEAQRRALQAAQDIRPEKIVQRTIEMFNQLLHK
jgi:glycosyltransferase involved in cell wall biosynthesis